MFLAALWPLAWLLWAADTGNFSADPLADITHETGDWTLRFLCITLAMTPLRRLTLWNGAIRFRRMLGLFAFFYGTLHLLIYLIADRYASLDFPSGVLAWQSVRAFAASVWMASWTMYSALRITDCPKGFRPKIFVDIRPSTML